MATPDPTPTARQLAKLRGILGLDTSAQVLALVSDFETQDETDAEWAETLDDLATLASLKEQAQAKVKKVLDIVEFFGIPDVQAVANDIRARYGIEEEENALYAETSFAYVDICL